MVIALLLYAFVCDVSSEACRAQSSCTVEAPQTSSALTPIQLHICPACQVRARSMLPHPAPACTCVNLTQHPPASLVLLSKSPTIRPSTHQLISPRCHHPLPSQRTSTKSCPPPHLPPSRSVSRSPTSTAQTATSTSRRRSKFPARRTSGSTSTRSCGC